MCESRRIDKEQLNEDYERYVSLKYSDKQKAEFIVHSSKVTKKFIQMAMLSFKIRGEYYSEAKYWLMNDYFRAFDTYRTDSGATLFTWVYRLLVQSAYNFIKLKTKELNRNSVVFGIETTPEVGKVAYESMDSLDTVIYEEDRSRYTDTLNLILDSIKIGPIEREVYLRQNGACGYTKESPEQIAESMRLTDKTVMQIIKSNQNKFYNFRKYLKENGISFTSATRNDIMRFRNYSPRRRKTSRK